ncbi:hypothetical protein ACJJIE_07725 [Microbulbifer sp. TRSA001]|uniref:hypothetical protein n=1 Tax=Microbulbifer sp. TRSA001 TaxID=3243381 RepID=UPI004039543E
MLVAGCLLVRLGLKLTMKKCCGKYLIPKIDYKASLLDSLGLCILLGFFIGIAIIATWLASVTLVSSIEGGSFTERGIFGQRIVPGGVVVLLFLYYFLPKVINASSYLVNYTLKIDIDNAIHFGQVKDSEVRYSNFQASVAKLQEQIRTIKGNLIFGFGAKKLSNGEYATENLRIHIGHMKQNEVVWAVGSNFLLNHCN